MHFGWCREKEARERESHISLPLSLSLSSLKFSLTDGVSALTFSVPSNFHLLYQDPRSLAPHCTRRAEVSKAACAFPSRMRFRSLALYIQVSRYLPTIYAPWFFFLAPARVRIYIYTYTRMHSLYICARAHSS